MCQYGQMHCMLTQIGGRPARPSAAIVAARDEPPQELARRSTAVCSFAGLEPRIDDRDLVELCGAAPGKAEHERSGRHRPVERAPATSAATQ